MLDPIIKSIEVPCNQEMAFEVFLNKMDSWWPLDRFTTSAMAGEPARSIRVEAKQGGNIVEVGSGGAETLWGTINSCEPHGFLSMDFHVPQPGEKVESRSLVEVRFTSLGDEQTRVQLTQSNWEALGEMAEAMHSGYSGAWVAIFEQAYKSACGG